MDLKSKNLRFYPQHINKCYCQKSLAYCDNIAEKCKNSKNPSASQCFVKTRSECGNLKSIHDESCLNSKYHSKCSFQCESNNDLFSLGLHFNYKKDENLKSDIKNLTERRQYYEQLRRNQRDNLNAKTSIGNCSHQQIRINHDFLDNIDHSRIEEISKYRLENVEDCFSIQTKYSIADKLLKDKLKKEKEHKHCEFRFNLNERELLQPTDIDKNGKLICTTCNKKHENFCHNGIVPSSIVHKVILNIHDNDDDDDNDKITIKNKDKTDKGKFKKRHYTLSNSLALRYQEMI